MRNQAFVDSTDRFDAVGFYRGGVSHVRLPPVSHVSRAPPDVDTFIDHFPVRELFPSRELQFPSRETSSLLPVTFPSRDNSTSLAGAGDADAVRAEVDSLVDFFVRSATPVVFAAPPLCDPPPLDALYYAQPFKLTDRPKHAPLSPQPARPKRAREEAFAAQRTGGTLPPAFPPTRCKADGPGEEKAEGACAHGVERRKCPQCKGMCPHLRVRRTCKECRGASVCEHRRIRNTCKECGGTSICPHFRMRRECRECGGKSYCVHDRIRRTCKDCGGSARCKHGKIKYYCKEPGCYKKKQKRGEAKPPVEPAAGDAHAEEPAVEP